MPRRDTKLEDTLETVRNLHADTTVHIVVTLRRLEEVHDLCKELIEACEADLQP